MSDSNKTQPSTIVTRSGLVLEPCVKPSTGSSNSSPSQTPHWEPQEKK